MSSAGLRRERPFKNLCPSFASSSNPCFALSSEGSSGRRQPFMYRIARNDRPPLRHLQDQTCRGQPQSVITQLTGCRRGQRKSQTCGETDANRESAFVGPQQPPQLNVTGVV